MIFALIVDWVMAKDADTGLHEMPGGWLRTWILLSYVHRIIVP